MRVLIHDGPRVGETVDVRAMDGAPPSRLHFPVPQIVYAYDLDADPIGQGVEVDTYEAARWATPAIRHVEWRYRYVGRAA